MSQASEQIAKQFAAAANIKNKWGSDLLFYNAIDQGCAGNGTTDDYTKLNTLISSTINGADATILFPKGTYKIGTNITIPSNISLCFVKGAMLSPDSGVTVTINGPVQADLWKIFTGSGTIAGNMKVDAVYSEWWGAKADGVTDDFAAIQAAINAATNTFCTVFVSPGTYMISSQLIISKAITFEIHGTLKASTTGTAGTALIKITSDNVIILGPGTIDGNNKLWCGIHAENDTAVIENVTVDNVRFENIAIDSTSAFGINLSSVKNGRITNNNLKNIGVINNVVGGGFGIYTQFCQGTIIEGNRLNKVGSSGINISSGTDNVARDNDLFKITLFGYKAGYGLTTTVSADVAPTTTTFSIVKNASTTKQWFVGTNFLIILSDTTKTTGFVKKIEDFTTYYKITCTLLDSLPVVGKGIELPDTGTQWLNNSLNYCGDNGFDINITSNVLIDGNTLRNCGWYQDVGIFVGLRTGIWIGADPQGAVQPFESDGVIITNNKIYNTYGSAIQLFATENAIISNNRCKDYNEGQDPASTTPAYGGIDVGRTGFYRIDNIVISNNKCISPYGYGIFAGFFLNGQVSDNIVKSKAGIKINTGAGAIVSDNLVEATGNSSYALLISDDSAANPSSGIDVKGNQLRANGSTSYGINITDAGATGIFITPDNTITVISGSTEIASSATAKISKEEYVTIADTPIVANLFETAEGHYKNSLAAAATKTVASFNADNGTGGMVEIIGIAREGTTNAEAFRLVAWGGYLAGSNAVSLTSLGVPRGVSFLAAGDFTVVANGVNGLIDVKYTNNEAGTVFISCVARSVSRF